MGVQHLLLRVGVVSRLYECTHLYRGRRVVSYVVTVTGHDNLRCLWRAVGRHCLQASPRARLRALANGGRGRGTRDVVPVGVTAQIRREREREQVTWKAIGRMTGLSMRAVGSPASSKQGYQRGVIARPGRYFDSPELMRLASSDLYWDRVVSVEPVGERETYDLEIEGDHNFLANDLVVHNSHASSFALLAYASAWLKVHEPAAFYAALLNNQPMGFYHAATVVTDARRHGLRILPIDVTRSAWLCTLEDFGADAPRAGRWAVRLGLRYVKGLRETAARALVAAREWHPFVSPDDVAARAGLDREEMTTLASLGAFAALGGTRRANLWTAAVPHPGPLFADAPAPPAARSPLADMVEAERIVADYAGSGVTLGRHPMAAQRAALTPRGVWRATDLAMGADGARVRVAGSVIVRQRPGTAKGFVFLTLEDETGIANVIVTPGLFARQRPVLVAEPFLLVDGILQVQDAVVSVRASRVEPLPHLAHTVPSHDFG
jgi:hypothetical protein